MTVAQEHEKMIHDIPESPGILMVEPSKITSYQFDCEIMKEFSLFYQGEKIKVDVLPVELGSKLVLSTENIEAKKMEVRVSQIKHVGAFEEERGFMDTKNLMVRIILKNDDEIVLFLEAYKINQFVSLVSNYSQLDNSYWDFFNWEFKNRNGFESTRIFYKTPFLAIGEKLMWSYAGMEGAFDKKTTFLMALTNFRAIIYYFETHECEYVLLSDLDEIMATNSRQIYPSDLKEGFSLLPPNNTQTFSRTNIEKDKSQTIGDIVFIKNGETKIKFGQMVDPRGLASFAQSIKKNVIIRSQPRTNNLE